MIIGVSVVTKPFVRSTLLYFILDQKFPSLDELIELLKKYKESMNYLKTNKVEDSPKVGEASRGKSAVKNVKKFQKFKLLKSNMKVFS